jgi:hypothetical protein
MRPRAFLIGICLAGLLSPVVFGLDPAVDQGQADVVPWSGFWWPIKDGGIIDPLCKYDQITGRKAAPWEMALNPLNDKAEDWFGYCHGWSAAAVLEQEPRRPVTVIGRDDEPVELTVGDLKGLLSACHTRDPAMAIGPRSRDEKDPPEQRGLPPDVLWRMLHLFVQRRGLPLILDIELGREVWNFPVYAYRVQYTPVGERGDQVARLTLVLADDNVDRNYVGIQPVRQTYFFRFRMQGNAILMGTGKWLGPSQENHPKLAWYPLAARTANPQLSYRTVRRLVADSFTSESPTLPDVWDDPAETEPGDAGLPPPPRPIGLSSLELAAIIAGQTSAFKFDLSVKPCVEGRYVSGERFGVRGLADEGGYLYLLHISPQGELRLLFPQADEDNRIAPQQRFEIGGDLQCQGLRIDGAPGSHRIKALVSTRPLSLSGLSLRSPSGQAGEFRWHPTEREQMRRFMRLYLHGQLKTEDLGGMEPAKLLPRFAQADVNLDIRSPGGP